MTDYLAQFKQGKSIEVQKTEEEIQMDKEYKEPPKVSFKEQQDGFRKLFLNPKTEEKINNEPNDSKQEKTKLEVNNKQNIESNETQRRVEESPYTPLIDGLIENKLLKKEEGELVKNTLLDNKDNIKEAIKDIKGLSSEKKKQLTDTIKFLNGPEAKKQSQEKFNKDFQEEIAGLKEKVEGGKKGEKELQGKNKELIEKIGGNYFNLSDLEGGKETNKEALNRAFKTTLNQLMDGKNFKRSDSFDLTLNIIRDPEASFKERFEELKKVDKLINDDQSRANGRQSKSFEQRKKVQKVEEMSIEERFEGIKLDMKIAKDKGNEEMLKELQIEIENLKEEVEASGEVFEGSEELDILLSEIKDNLKEQA